MANFQEIIDCKNDAIIKILADMELCKAVYYTEDDFIDQPDFDVLALPDQNLFPHRFVPEENAAAETFVTITAVKFGPASGGYFKSGQLVFNIFTHKSLFKTAYAYTRVDFILSRISAIMHQARGYGLGGLAFLSMDELVVNDNFHGSYLAYEIVDSQ